MKNCFPFNRWLGRLISPVAAAARLSSESETLARSATMAIALAAFAGCAKPGPSPYQGYLEGEYVYVGAPLAGRLETLAVHKGSRVEAGAPLFTLERTSELAAQRQAADQLRSAQARFEDLKKGSRPTELATLEARLAQARTAAEQAQTDFVRQQTLVKGEVISPSEFDRAKFTNERSQQAVAELEAQLATARLGARSDAIAAAEADVSAATAAKERADWSVDQKAQTAPRGGLIYDTLYRVGEFVATGNPVVALLPPENLKVRFFVPEGEFAALKAGDKVRVAITGMNSPLEARVSFLSPQPEYTPPILYNRENRAKLVFMVEAVFDNAVASDLHPGQPVDVSK
jgi:HlyD family secretion protein